MAVITLQEISKFSVDTFKSSLLSRRKFMSALIAVSCLPTEIIAQAAQDMSEHSNHFYWVDLNTGQINLPAQRIETGQPGSLMKLVATAAILEEHLPSAQAIIDCRGSIIVGGQLYACRYPHGRLSLVEALGQSCNVFFAHTAKELNSDCFLHYLEKLALKKSIFLPETKPSHHSIDLILGLSKQFNINAIQILQLVSLIAKRGKLLPLYCNLEHTRQPRGVASRLGQEIFTKDPGLSEHTWTILQTGMQIACQKGTAKKLDPQNKLRLAAKTGTTLHGNKFQSWLAGYFPYDKPRYAFCLRANAGTSYDKAVPLARKLLFERDWT